MTKTARTSVITIVGIVVVALVGWFVIRPRLQPHVFAGQVIQSNQPAPAVELDGPNGTKVSLQDFGGKVVVLYFGYTYCPDVCPTTLAKLNQSLNIIGDKAQDVQVIMVTVDPERDTAEVLEQYMAHFNPTFMGLTGDPAAIDRVATTYGVYYEAEPSDTSEYLVNHTATVMVVDRDGYLKLVLPFEGTAEQIASDIEYFLG